MPSSSIIIFLRTPPDEGPDTYADLFTSAGYHAHSLAVLETVSINVQELRDVLSQGPDKLGIGGVVVSSGRAVGTWREAASTLAEAGGLGHST